MAKIEAWVPDTDDKHFWSRKRDDGSASAEPLQLIEVEGEEIRTRIRAIVSEFEDLVKDKPGARLVVDQIELSLTLSASGGIQLITKFDAGAEAAIKVTLRRAP